MNTRFWRAGRFLIAVALLGAGAAHAAAADKGGWRDCADEGQTCELRGKAMVRYGDDGRWNTRSVNGSVDCTNETFGDPAPQMRKRCQVRGGKPVATAGNANDWRVCAPENEVCRVRGQAEVRFGDGRRYETRTVRDQVRCDVATFGDPAQGVVKRCEVRAKSAVDAGDAGWQHCADEGDVCKFDGPAQVRYGTEGRYVYKDADRKLNCETRTFGSDPYKGQRKACDIRR